MKLSLVTVAFDAETCSFPQDPLSSVEGEVMSVVEHFFHFHGLPHLLLIVHSRAVGSTDRKKRKKGRSDPAEGLTPRERRFFEVLRAWRRGRAEADGVPVYVILKNRDLVEIAAKRPETLQQLQKIPGIGSGKADRYGSELLKLVEGDQDSFIPDPQQEPIAPPEPSEPSTIHSPREDQ